MATPAYLALIAALTGSPALRYWDIDSVALADGANITSISDTSGNGIALAPVPGGGASQAVYSLSAGHPSGWPSARFNGTGGLYVIDTPTANILGNAADRVYSIGSYFSLDNATLITQHVLTAANSTDNNPFFLTGCTNATIWRSSKRNNTGSPSNGLTGVSTAAATSGWVSWIFVISGTAGSLTADIFINNVSATGGAGFAFSDAVAATINLIAIGCLYRPANGASQIGSAMTGNWRRSMLIGSTLNSTQRGLLHALLIESPQSAMVATMPGYSVYAITSSTGDGNSLPNPNDAFPLVLQARHGFALTKFSTSSGLEVCHTLPIGTVNPAPFEAVQNTYSITNAIAANPKLILYHVQTGRLFSAYQAFVTAGFVGSREVYMETVLSMLGVVINAALTANKEILFNACSQPTPTTPNPVDDAYMGRYFRRRQRELFGWRFVDQFPLLGLDDGTANATLFIAANTHPNAAGQLRIADAFSSRMRSLPTHLPRLYTSLDDRFAAVTSGGKSKSGGVVVGQTQALLTTGTKSRTGGVIVSQIQTPIVGAPKSRASGTVTGATFSASVITGAPKSRSSGTVTGVISTPPIDLTGEIDAVLGQRTVTTALIQPRAQGILGQTL